MKYAIRVIDGRHQVGVTTTGRDFAPLPRAAFPTPRAAITYASMREANVSPLRSESHRSPDAAPSGAPVRSRSGTGEIR